MHGQIEAITSASGARMRIGGRTVLNFAGSAYLGLAREPQIIAAGVAAMEAIGATATIPRHYAVAPLPNLDVEAAATKFFAVESAIYFATGYLFGLLAMAGLREDYDVVLLDEFAHYSLHDGALAAGKLVRRFRHCDADALTEAAADLANRGARILIATDGMFATTGNTPPLETYKQIAEQTGAWLVVDESHSFGVFGENGRGLLESAGVAGDRVLAGGSVGKAFGAYGGLALGSVATIERLWQTPVARGATAGMSSGAAMAAASMTILRAQPERLAALRRNGALLKQGLARLGFSLPRNASPVAAFVSGSEASMQALQRELLQRDIFVAHSKYIGASAAGVIRCAAFADHQPADFEELFDALAGLL